VFRKLTQWFQPDSKLIQVFVWVEVKNKGETEILKLRSRASHRFHAILSQIHENNAFILIEKNIRFEKGIAVSISIIIISYHVERMHTIKRLTTTKPTFALLASLSRCRFSTFYRDFPSQVKFQRKRIS